MLISEESFLLGGRRTAGITMAPLTKDTSEVTNSAAETGSSNRGTPAKASPAGHLRSDAVSLEVPVKVHGSRVTEVAREITPHTEPFEEQTSTMIVFPQGAVIRMSTSVNVGQMLVVTNLKSRQDAICRVVKVRTFSNLQGYVEVEFTHQQPGYWGVHFPSEGPAAIPVIQTAPVISAAAPVVIPETPVKAAPEQNVSMPVAPVAPAAPVSFVAPVAPPPAAPVVPAAFTPT